MASLSRFLSLFKEMLETDANITLQWWIHAHKCPLSEA